MTLADPRASTPTASEGGGLRSVARGGAANLVGSVVSGAAAFAVTVVVARSLPQADAGVFFSLTSLFLLVTTLAQLGTATGVVYFVARVRALGRVATIPAILRTAMWPVLVVGAAAAAVGLVAAGHLAPVVLDTHVGSATVYLRVLSIFIPAAGAETVWLAATRGFGTMRVNAVVELVGRPLLQLVLVAVVLGLHSPGWLAVAWGSPYVVAAMLAGLAWHRRRRRLGLPRRAVEPLPESFWRFTGPRALTSVVQMVMQRFDIVLVGALAGARAAAVYTAATRFVVVGQSVTSAFTQATQPMLGQAMTHGDHRAAAEIYQLSTAWLVVLTWPVYLILLIFRDTLLGVFGHGYDAGAGVLVWLSSAMLLSVACGLVDVVLTMAAHTGWNLANAGLALVCNLGLDLWLIPRHGLLGAAIGWAVAIAVRNVAALIQVAVALKMHPFVGATWCAAGIAVAAFAGLPLLVRAVFEDTPTTLIAAVLLGCALWCAAVWFLRRRLRVEAFGLPILRDSHLLALVHHGRAS